MDGSRGLATLIVNPAAGRADALNVHLEAIEQLLACSGYTTQIVQTTRTPGSATSHARAAAETSSLVLACGGDGTVHSIIQSLANTRIPLGVVPLGTANALARNLALPMHPLRAVQRLLLYVPRIVPLGIINKL